MEPLGDADLTRLAYEYLPPTFSRRHGDPSRPWNRFEIRVRDPQGNSLLGFQGNWRDIFQNWEALSVPFPDFVESIIVKFVNASTADGYNPYRITQDGIDWEVPEPDHPWAAIGYWGDHQVIYLTKLIELSRSHHPERLRALLERELFTYANVPYRIRPYVEILRNVRDTIEFDHAKQKLINARVAERGSDGRLLADDQALTRVSLLEKLWVTDAGQAGQLRPRRRPVAEYWTPGMERREQRARRLRPLDGHHLLPRALPGGAGRADGAAAGARALVQRGRRHLAGAQRGNARTAPGATGQADARRPRAAPIDGRAGRRCLGFPRQAVRRRPRGQARLANLARRWVNHTIAANRREDGLYHAYNLLSFKPDGSVAIEHLYEMLEGQVAALSTRAMAPEEALRVLDALANSRMHRADQESYTLYPDRRLPRFLEKNSVDDARLKAAPLLRKLLESGERRIIFGDQQGTVRFHESFASAERLEVALREPAAPKSSRLRPHGIA